MEDYTIYNLAKEYRKAIEKCKNKLGLEFKYFPKGTCGDTSILLGQYLKEVTGEEFYFYSGERGCMIDNSWESHAWIQNEELIVDITGDQFVDNNCEVFVGIKSKFHNKFCSEAKHIAKIDIYDEMTINMLIKKYKTIMNVIKNNCET